MYYEEKFIDKMLMCRTSPDGEWRIKGGTVAIVANQVQLLSDSDKEHFFKLFGLKEGS